MNEVRGLLWRLLAQGLRVGATLTARWAQHAQARAQSLTAPPAEGVAGPEAARGGPPAHWLADIAARAPHLLDQPGAWLSVQADAAEPTEDAAPPRRWATAAPADRTPRPQRVPPTPPVQARTERRDPAPPVPAQPYAAHPARAEHADLPPRPLRLRPTPEVTAQDSPPAAQPALPPEPGLMSWSQAEPVAAEPLAQPVTPPRPPVQSAPRTLERPPSQAHPADAPPATPPPRPAPTAPLDVPPYRVPAQPPVAAAPPRAPRPKLDDMPVPMDRRATLRDEEEPVPSRYAPLPPSPLPSEPRPPSVPLPPAAEAPSRPRPAWPSLPESPLRPRAVDPAPTSFTPSRPSAVAPPSPPAASPADRWPSLPATDAPAPADADHAAWRAVQRRRRLDLEQEGRAWNE